MFVNRTIFYSFLISRYRLRTQLVMHWSLCLILLFIPSFATAAEPMGINRAITTYEPTPQTSVSVAYQLQADSHSVVVVHFGDMHYARFILNGPTPIRITANGLLGRSVTISPMRHALETLVTGDDITFSITRPGSYVCQIEGMQPLALFADEPIKQAPNLNDPQVIPITRYLDPHRDPSVPITASLQKAVDDTANNNNGMGGILYLNKGHYISAQLQLKSNVHLYLEDGALLQAQSNFSHQHYPKQNGDDSSFIYIKDAKNVALSGRGVIDGNGYEMRTKTPKANVKLLRTFNASDISVDGIYFRDSARWTIHLLQSQGVSLKNIKIINDLRADNHDKIIIPRVSNTDGIDIDASRDIHVDHAFIYTGDDAFTPKVTGYMGALSECSHITLSDNVIWTMKCALKVGTETLRDIHDVTFTNNDIIKADRGVALYATDGGRIANIQVINNYAEFIGGNIKERHFLIRAKPDSKTIKNPGKIENVLIKDYYANALSPQSSSIEGYDAENNVSKIQFSNLQLNMVRIVNVSDFSIKVEKFVQELTLLP